MRARLRAVADLTHKPDHQKSSASGPEMFISSLDSDDFVLLDQLAEKGQGLPKASDKLARVELPSLSGYNRLPFALRW
jgi:hypothetical protein